MRSKRSIVANLFLFGILLSSISCSDYEIIKRDQGDVFYQLQAGEVDILLVVDNSCSMQPYQEKLAENFDNFLTFFVEGDVDYRIGVSTTTIQEIEYDPDWTCSEEELDAIPPAGMLVNDTVITPDTSDGSETFSSIVSVGTCGSGSEMGLESALQVLENNSAGMLREDAYLSVIFVSDEEDASPLPVNDYINSFRAVKDADAREVFNASSLVVSDLDDCSEEQVDFGAAVGSRYLDVAQQADGIVGDICGDDFSSIVTELSLSSSRLNDTFYLAAVPDVATMILGINEEEITCDSDEYIWSFAMIGDEETGQPALVFDRETMPPPDSKITLQYNLGDGNMDDFCQGGE